MDIIRACTTMASSFLLRKAAVGGAVQVGKRHSCLHMPSSYPAVDVGQKAQFLEGKCNHYLAWAQGMGTRDGHKTGRKPNFRPNLSWFGG